MKKLFTMVAAIWMATFAFATNIESVERINVNDDYRATPVYSAAAHNLSDAGWCAGLELTWKSESQVATSTQASVSDNLNGTIVGAFTVGAWSGLSFVDKSPSGSGLSNTFKKKSGLSTTQYLATTKWYFLVTPDMMKTCAQQDKDYEVMLTIGDNTFTVTVPRTVTLVDDEGFQLYPIAEQINISGETLILSPGTSFLYDATEKMVTPTLSVNGLTATFDVAEGSVTNATEIGTYTVTVNGTGNFTGTASATWEIVNTTGAIGGVAAASAGYGDVENNTLTVTNTTALEYFDGAWYAGIALAWPMEKKDYSGIGQYGYAHYVATNSSQVTIGEGAVVNETASSKYRYNLLSGEKDFTYLATTTWEVAITPEIVESALAASRPCLDYTMTAGAFVWEDANGREGNPDGVAFADYTITLPLGEPVVFSLGEGEAYDLGETKLSTTKIQLSQGASVTSAVEQVEGAIYTTAVGCEIERSEVEGKYIYTAKFVHVHDWSFEVVDGTNLVATCANYECDMNDGEVTMWLHVDATEKVYDGNAVACKAEYGDGFKTAFPAALAVVTVNGEAGPIKDAGTYEVVLNVTGLGDDKVYSLASTVTVSSVDISSAEITLSATEIITRGEAVGVAISQVKVDDVLLMEGTDYYIVDDSSVLEASQIGEYTVTINGKGGYSGSAAATWKIIEPQGAFADDAMSVKTGDPAYGCIDPENPRRLNITNTVALVYKNDDDGERWEAAVEISWPHRETAFETYFFSQVATKVQYTDAQHAAVKVGEEEVAWGDEILAGERSGLAAMEGSAKYYKINGLLISEVQYDYFDKLIWTVAIKPADLQAAIESGAKHLEYSIVCGSVAWGDETDGDMLGIADTEFSVSMSLAKVFLLDGEGRQVFPAHNHEWIVGLSEDGTMLAAKCVAEGCYLAETTGELHLEMVAKDATAPEYAEGHYRDGVAAEALLKGADTFYPTGATIGDVRYFTESGDALASAPVEPGRYYAIAEVTFGANVWPLRVDGLEILAGEAALNGIHVKDASEYLERATGDSMQIAAGKSYTAAKAYKTPAKYGILNLSCGVKTYDLAGFTVTAAVDQPLFENNGKLVITDTSEGSTGTIAANQASSENTLIVNTGTLTIEGGTFLGAIVNDGGTISITGGRFSVKPDASFVAEGYDLVRRGNVWSVEKHEHDYRLVVVGGRLAIATCCNVLADESLQISHCDSRQLVGILGLRKSFTGLTKGVPTLSVDYDRKEHAAEFYAINMTTLNAVITDASLLSIIKDVVENVDFENLAETDVLNLLTVLAQNDGFSDVLKNVLGIYVEADGFEKLTGYKLGNVQYATGGEALEGVPCEAGDYTATISITLPGGNEKTVKGSFRINEKELPIETEGHDTHIWSFKEDGATITATCPGNLLRGIECNASPMAIELVPSAEGGRKVYDAEPIEVTVSNLNTFVINTDANVGELVYRAADGTEMESAPVEPGNYTAELEITRGEALIGGLFRYTATLPLVIEEKTPTGNFPVCGWTKHVGSATAALEIDGDALYYPVELDWPYQIEQVVLTPRFTDPAHARISISTSATPFTGTDLLEGKGEELGLAAEAGEFFRIKKLKNQTYMKGITWLVPFTFAEIDEARAAGVTEIVRSITLEGKCCEDDLEGLAPTTYTIVLDVENLVINDSEGRQIYPIHNHSWMAENTGSVLTLVCDADGCPQAPGLVAELSVDFESKRYDTLPAKATLTGADAMRIHAAVEFGEIVYVELGDESVEYSLGREAPSTPGRYRVEVEYSNGVDVIGTLSVEFEILPLDASGICAYFNDPKSVFVYTGEAQGPDLSSVWYGIVPLRYGVDYVIEGDLSATDVGEYSFAIVGTGNFEGRREFEWSIVEPSRPFAPCALKIPGGMCSPHWGVVGCDGMTAYVVNSTNLLYDAVEGRWTAPLTIDWPENIDGLLLTPAVYTDPAHAKVEADCGEVYLVTSFFKRPLALCPEEYVVKVLWLPSFTMDDVVAAFNDGKDELVFELTVGSNAWACDPFGLKATTFRLVVPIKSLVHDDEPIDWYWIEYLGNGATSGKMAIERRLTSESMRLTDCAYKNTGLNMLGWSFDDKAEGVAGLDFADRQFVSKEFEVGVTNTIYAIWTTNVVICGDIVGDQYKNVSSISVWGVGSTIDDAIEGRAFGSQSPWRYVAEVPAKGAYDIAAQSENQDGAVSTTTVLVIATPDPEEGTREETKVSEPVGDVSSTVDNTEAGNFPAVVGGLPQIAEKAAETEAAGTTVEVCFTVKEMPSADTTVGYASITNKYPSGHAKPLDFSLMKFVDGVFMEKLHDLTAYSGLVQVIVPFNREGRRNLKVVRYHEETEGDPATGSVEPLPEGVANANAAGECFEFDETTNELLVRGAKLSTYALLWDGAVVSQRSLVWHVDWLSGMYVPEIELEVKPGDGWANSVSNMSFMLEKRDGIRLWDAKTNAEVAEVVNVGGVDYYKVSLKDRFVDNDVAGADSDIWGAAWYDATGKTWVNAMLSEVLLYAPQYWPNNPTNVPAIDKLVAYVSYESYECESRVVVGENTSMIKALSAVAPRMLAAAPASVADLNASLAVGAPVSVDSEPYCKIVGFAVADGVLKGAVEVGAGSTKGSVGSNASVVVVGAKSLADGFAEIAVVECDADGNFSIAVPDVYKFFKVALSVTESVK